MHHASLQWHVIFDSLHVSFLPRAVLFCRCSFLFQRYTYKALGQYEKARWKQIQQAEAFSKLEELYELPVTSYSEPGTTLEEFKVLKTVCEYNDMVKPTYCYCGWSTQESLSINTESLNGTNKMIFKMLRKFVNQNAIAIVKGWSTYVAYMLPSKCDSSSGKFNKATKWCGCPHTVRVCCTTAPYVDFRKTRTVSLLLLQECSPKC